MNFFPKHSFIVCFFAALDLFCCIDNTCQGQNAGKTPHVVFLINEDPLNYEADRTIPPFADSLEKAGLFRTTVLKGNGTHDKFSFDDLKVIDKADVLVVFCRRVALPHHQMDKIKKFIRSGRPVVGIRTANHGFSVREKSAADGHEGWWGFVPDILGHENKGYEPEELGTYVEVNPDQVGHPILKGISHQPWKSKGSVYKVSPLIDQDAVILLTGSTSNGKEPAAWIRKNHYGGKVFYTSLGYPADFSESQFRQLLINGLDWAVAR